VYDESQKIQLKIGFDDVLINKQAPTYLHFLDRELRRAENADYNDEIILDAIILLL